MLAEIQSLLDLSNGKFRFVFHLICSSDDGNSQDGDGCFNCNLELGYRCATRDCTTVTTTCGDGIVVLAKEDCDIILGTDGK